MPLLIPGMRLHYDTKAGRRAVFAAAWLKKKMSPPWRWRRGWLWLCLCVPSLPVHWGGRLGRQTALPHSFCLPASSSPSFPINNSPCANFTLTTLLSLWAVSSTGGRKGKTLTETITLEEGGATFLEGTHTRWHLSVHSLLSSGKKKNSQNTSGKSRGQMGQWGKLASRSYLPSFSSQAHSSMHHSEFPKTRSTFLLSSLHGRQGSEKWELS